MNVGELLKPFSWNPRLSILNVSKDAIAESMILRDGLPANNSCHEWALQSYRAYRATAGGEDGYEGCFQCFTLMHRQSRDMTSANAPRISSRRLAEYPVTGDWVSPHESIASPVSSVQGLASPASSVLFKEDGKMEDGSVWLCSTRLA